MARIINNVKEKINIQAPFEKHYFCRVKNSDRQNSCLIKDTTKSF